MKTNYMKVIILVLILVIISMSFYCVKMENDLLELKRMNSVLNQDVVLDKKQFDIFKVLTIDKEYGYITIKNGERYEGKVCLTVGSSWSEKPVIIIGDSTVSGVLQGRLDTFQVAEDGACIIKRKYISNGEKNIFGEYIFSVNGDKHTIPFRFGPFAVE